MINGLGSMARPLNGVTGATGSLMGGSAEKTVELSGRKQGNGTIGRAMVQQVMYARKKLYF
jgi:hypothetical protein